ncbi:hypothetical protein RvY_16783 [Ramazzottius varieornatus]|uniref:Thioesterase domain-containing protein n=1 Tax=Ramazzottius varieornatus TaxID=947166 RepID=A0A1D1W400_RAMVA|nr:hypothetical protein RvY_16783 [Ramazzottius varieornatus]
MASKKFGQIAKMFEKYVKHVKGIEGLLSTGKLVSLEEGKVVYEMEVMPEQCNAGKTMHGAFAALLVDNLTGAAICTKLTTNEELPMFSGVSVAMNLKYLRASKLGETVTVTAEVLKIGRNLAVAQCDIVGKDDGKLRVTGQHTKFVGQNNS